jgi:hypothetical protein
MSNRERLIWAAAVIVITIGLFFYSSRQNQPVIVRSTPASSGSLNDYLKEQRRDREIDSLRQQLNNIQAEQRLRE